MATRLKEGMIPYTWWIGIEITDNHVINVLLRALNNLIHVNEDRELFVDLQIPDGVEPDYDFEVGVTTGRILEEDWWPQNATILNWKTTSGDYVRLIYAADDKLYYDPWTWEWRLLATWEMVEEALTDSNTKTFWIEDNQDLTNAQAAYDWYMDGKSPILMHEWLFGMQMFTLGKDETNWTTHILAFAWGEEIIKGSSDTIVKAPMIQFQAEDWEVQSIVIQYWREFDVLETGFNYTVPYTPLFDWSPATKKYVDDWLATKQDKLTAWTNITIDQNNVISATLPTALVYKGNVQTINDLPSSWQTVWDTYFVEWVDGMYSWDWTQWNYVGSTSPSLTNYFNMTINDSDDITEWSVHLFCSTSEKNYWNWKQDALTAWANIQISNNVISATDTTYSAWTAMELVWNTFNNTKPFDPENAWTLSQVLKKTSTGYRWANETEWFDPENAGTTGQVLKKTSTGYSWQDESWGWGWGWATYTGGDWISVNNSTHIITNTKPFDPSAWGTVWQVLTKTANGYNWQTIAGGEGNVKLFTLSSTSDTTTAQAAYDWYNGWKLPIIRMNATISRKDSAWTVHNIEGDFDFYPEPDSTDNWKLKFYTIHNWENCTITQWWSQIWDYTSDVDIMLTLSISWWNVTSISQTTQTNSQREYLATNVDYTNPYIPQYPWSPATKAYVDSVAWWWSWITNNTTWTTSTINQEWVWTQAEYDALVNSWQIMWGIIYNILPS